MQRHNILYILYTQHMQRKKEGIKKSMHTRRDLREYKNTKNAQQQQTTYLQHIDKWIESEEIILR